MEISNFIDFYDTKNVLPNKILFIYNGQKLFTIKSNTKIKILNVLNIKKFFESYYISRYMIIFPITYNTVKLYN